jgi:hypothetical protein
MLDANTDFNDINLAESEEAVEAALKYLRYKDPKNANRDYATKLLRDMQSTAKNIADKSGLSFEEFFEKYNESQTD